MSPSAKREGRCVRRANCACLLLCVFLFAVSVLAQQESPNWLAGVRERIAAQDFAAAVRIVDARLAAAPQDLDARGWRARLLAWSGRWQEAETEYRRILEAAPRDVDALVGLSYVLSWQRRYDEALAVLDRAEGIDASRADIFVSRGRTLRAMGQTAGSRTAFRNALACEPKNQDALAGLASLVEEPRFALSFATDVDTFNFTGTAYAYTTSLAVRINPRWDATLSGIAQSRFGEDAGRFLSSVGYRVTRRDSLRVGGGAAHDQGVVPKSEGFFEYGHGFNLGERGFVRGVEAAYHQHWYWYRGARVLALTPRIALALPREWNLSFQVTAARSNFAGLPPGWSPSGSTRLTFPLRGALRGSVSYAVGTEDFALSDQIGRFAARTYAGGLSYWWKQRQQFSGYIALQDRSQGRSQMSYGVGYAVRF